MAVTQNSYTGNGSTTTYSFTFPYLKTSDIKASLDATVTTAFTLPNATTVQFNTAPANGAKIKIYRETDDSALAATFYAGSAVKSEDLNDNFTQNLYSTQEVTARYLSNLGGTMVGDLTLDEDADIIFEGATADAYETVLAATDPTADRTVTIPDATGTVGLLQSDQAWSGAQRGTVATPATHSSGATYDFDMNAGNNHKLTVGAAVEIGFSNITAGQSGTIEVVNGAFTPTFGSEIHFVGGTVPSLTQSATSFLAYYCPSDTVVFVQHMLNVKQGGT